MYKYGDKINFSWRGDTPQPGVVVNFDTSDGDAMGVPIFLGSIEDYEQAFGSGEGPDDPDFFDDERLWIAYPEELTPA